MMNETIYASMDIEHPAFSQPQHAIIALPNDGRAIYEYREPAKEKACAKLGLDPKDATAFNYRFLGFERPVVCFD